MDLKKYYLENITKDEYYYNFFDFINDINCTDNVFLGREETNNYEFNIYDIEEAIEKFKGLCQPEKENHTLEDKCWFYLISFYLYKNGYFIKEFPRVLARPPKDTFEFVNKEIRNKLIISGKEINGKVPHKERRLLVARFTFKQNSEHIQIDEYMEQKFKEISTRNTSFDKMSIDEKILEIANLIENFLKKEDKFITLDYSKMCFDYISEETIKKYRKSIQCFRHSSEEALKEREEYSEEQKSFIIDYGLIILKVIHTLLNNKIS